MSVINDTAETLQKILEFLSRLESGDFSRTLSPAQAPCILSPIIDKLNKLAVTLESQAQAQAQAQAEKALSENKKNINDITDNITEREHLSGALKESEKDFRLLAESMPQIVWATRADGWNIFFNHQWVEYTGLTLEESAGHGWNKPFHPEDQKRAWIAWQNATQNGATYSLRCRLRRTDGMYKWWLVRGVPVKDARGTIIKWFGTCTDIDELMQAEIALSESEKRYRELFSSMDEGASPR
jgi:PAS domain S-box-containing protein